jgi:hypothetical protein
MECCRLQLALLLTRAGKGKRPEWARRNRNSKSTVRSSRMSRFACFGLLTRHKVELHFEGVGGLGRGVLPLLYRVDRRINQNRIASDRRDTLYCSVRRDYNRQPDHPTDLVGFQVIGVFGRNMMQKPALRCVLCVQRYHHPCSNCER